jgi:hypothetical protein
VCVCWNCQIAWDGNALGGFDRKVMFGGMMIKGDAKVLCVFLSSDRFAFGVTDESFFWCLLMPTIICIMYLLNVGKHTL